MNRDELYDVFTEMKEMLGDAMDYKFTMERVVDDIREQFQATFGPHDILVYFSYWTKDGVPKPCFETLNGSYVETYQVNMMAAQGDERRCLCVYSPYRARLSRRSIKGFDMFDLTKAQGRPILKEHNLRTPECPGCQLTINDMDSILTIQLMHIDQTFRQEKEAELKTFLKQITKEVSSLYGLHIKKSQITHASKEI